MDSKEFHLPTGLPITLNADEWDYLAEGNEHMIFKYNGNIPNFIGTVIRVRKVMNALPVKLEKREFIMEHYLQEHYLKELVNEYCFKPHPVIGDMTKINILDVKNKDEFIMKLIERNENARPEFRRKKTINPETNFELIFDYTFSLEKFSTHTHRYASLALEIKPKCAKHDEISFEKFKKIHDKVAAELGIAADSCTEEEIEKMYNNYVSKEGYEKLCASGHEDRVKFTRFFKTQLKKQQEKKVEGFTRFDPHDFFHQDIANIKKAFKQLLETPQNNLKVFVKGFEVKPEDHKNALKEILEHFLQLTHTTSEANQKVQTEQELMEEFGGLLAELFKATEMIGIIEMFQDMYQGSSLAMLDILENLEKQVKETNYELTQDKLMEIVKKVAENKPHNNNGSMDIHDLIETVIRFLISIAFRDCSIILSLQFLPHEELEDLQLAKVLEEKGYKTYNGKNSKYKIMYTAGLVDFHMKGINHAYSHPVSTKELFGLLIKHLYEIKTNGEKST